VRSFGLDHRVVNNHVVDLPVIVYSLSFVFKVGIRASDDGVDFVMGG
jgi:hypothetical protein